MSLDSIKSYSDYVKFEDVDLAGYVYHPKFLSFFERARSQFLSDHNYSFKQMLDSQLGFVVAGVEMKFLKPLKLEDHFSILTQINSIRGSFFYVTQVVVPKPTEIPSFNLKDNLRKLNSIFCFAHMKLCVISTKTGRPTKVPKPLLGLSGQSKTFLQ